MDKSQALISELERTIEATRLQLEIDAVQKETRKLLDDINAQSRRSRPPTPPSVQTPALEDIGYFPGPTTTTRKPRKLRGAPKPAPRTLHGAYKPVDVEAAVQNLGTYEQGEQVERKPTRTLGQGQGLNDYVASEALRTYHAYHSTPAAPVTTTVNPPPHDRVLNVRASRTTPPVPRVYDPPVFSPTLPAPRVLQFTTSGDSVYEPCASQPPPRTPRVRSTGHQLRSSTLSIQ